MNIEAGKNKILGLKAKKTFSSGVGNGQKAITSLKAKSMVRTVTGNGKPKLHAKGI